MFLIIKKRNPSNKLYWCSSNVILTIFELTSVHPFDGNHIYQTKRDYSLDFFLRMTLNTENIDI